MSGEKEVVYFILLIIEAQVSWLDWMGFMDQSMGLIFLVGF